MKLNEATIWFLAGWAVTFPIAAPKLIVGEITQDGFLFLTLLGGLVAVLVGMIIDLIATIRQVSHDRKH